MNSDKFNEAVNEVAHHMSGIYRTLDTMAVHPEDEVYGQLLVLKACVWRIEEMVSDLLRFGDCMPQGPQALALDSDLANVAPGGNA